MTIDLDRVGAFTAAYNAFKTLMLSVFNWLTQITIGGVPLLYINLGFVLLITLFAILLPVLRNNGANELNNIGERVRGSRDDARDK